MLIETLIRMQEYASRLREIVGVLAKYGLSDWLARVRVGWLRRTLRSSHGERLDQMRTEERVRLALTDLGVTFVKLGQMLSTRPDLVGPSMADELSKLQHSNPADAPDAVRKTLETELGKPVEELFEKFDFQPIASGSIGQVHAAVLPGGREVAVKVMHHGIEEKISRDLNLLAGLAEFAQRHVEALRPYRPVDTVREFRRTLLRELDLTRE